MNCSADPLYMRLEELNAQYCYIKDQNYPYVTMSFPQNRRFQPEDFGPCDTSNFMSEFNNEGETIHKVMSEVELYGINFDLATLEKHTTERVTKKVIVRADTVYMSRDMRIFYK